MIWRTVRKDAAAIALLILLWLFFFWRMFTPIAADQASLARGDFSAQFVAFAGYQYERMTGGEIPLWNPYNNGGLPFIGDPQAAVFYPPRWLTIGISALSGGWSYNALQMEMTLHVLLGSFFMYGFARCVTARREGGRLGALVSAVVFAYGGYLTGYPPLQLAILETAIWLPLAALGVHAATRGALSLRWMALSGGALGLAWLAGHSQTSFLLSWLLLLHFAYRCWRARLGWRRFLLGGMALGIITIGAAAVTLLPSLEYLAHTSRAGMGYAQKGNGFPLKDLLQFILPGAFSLWSPLYVGLATLFFAGIAAFSRYGEARFWLAAAGVGALLSLGDNSPVFDLAYNLVPGLRFFRGQERAAVIVAFSLATAAGMGVAAACELRNDRHQKRAIGLWNRFATLLCAVAILSLILWFGDRDRFSDLLDIALRGAAIAVLSAFLLRPFLREPGKLALGAAVLALIVFDLFSVTQGHTGTYESRPASEQLSLLPLPLAQAVLDDSLAEAPSRVDGYRGLGGNYGSLYGIMDMRGISPLFLSGPQRLIQRDYVNNPLAWELMAARHVFSEKDRLSTPSTVIARGKDEHGAVHLHRLDDPRPYALLLVHADVVDSDAFALALLDDPRFAPREKVILHQPPSLDLSQKHEGGTAAILNFAPEAIDIAIDAPGNAILSLAQPHYVGWRAELNGIEIPILRAYTGLSALEIPAGRHHLALRYDPLSYRIGLLISLLTWLGLAAALSAIVMEARRGAS